MECMNLRAFVLGLSFAYISSSSSVETSLGIVSLSCEDSSLLLSELSSSEAKDNGYTVSQVYNS